jgi:6-pyruvoyltetrahydropterin/6-carboxytetrahydropterin synthase
VSGAHHAVKLVHNSETAHRLPQLPGKCRSVHGHSWQIQVTASFPALRQSIGAEFGAFKAGLRGWVDANLDHGTMLGVGDPLLPVLAGFPEIKLYVFGRGPAAVGEEKLAADLEWPTVENVAILLHRVGERVLDGVEHAPGGWVSLVEVQETGVNYAAYGVPDPYRPPTGEGIGTPAGGASG